MHYETLQTKLDNHKRWLEDHSTGFKADLSGADLSEARLSNANLSEARLFKADLYNANLSGADLSRADLSNANLSWADLSGAMLSNANLSEADLSGANLSWADLSGARLFHTNLSKTNLSGAKGLALATEYLEENFEWTAEGMIGYKIFGLFKTPNPNWVIEPNAVLTENVLSNRELECACGINVATLDWCRTNKRKYHTIWKVIILNAWLPGVVVPYHTAGKIRTEKLQLLEKIE